MIRRKIHSKLCDFYRNSNKALHLTGANVSIEKNIKYLPIYMPMYLYKGDPLSLLYQVDLPTI